MPVYEFFDGIKLSVYSNDHVPPHVHAQNAEFEAVISIKDLKVLQGFLPKIQMKKAVEFVKENREDLLEYFYELNPTIKKL